MQPEAGCAVLGQYTPPGAPTERDPRVHYLQVKRLAIVGEFYVVKERREPARVDGMDRDHVLRPDGAGQPLEVAHDGVAACVDDLRLYFRSAQKRLAASWPVR